MDAKWAMRIVTNCLEINVQDPQMFRCVAYFMLEIGAFEEAIALFRRVQDKLPAEPQSFIVRISSSSSLALLPLIRLFVIDH